MTGGPWGYRKKATEGANYYVRNVMVTLMMNRMEHKWIKAMAKAHGMSIAAYIRFRCLPVAEWEDMKLS